MDIIKDVPANAVSADVWKAGFMLLMCVVVFLLGYLISIFKATLKSLLDWKDDSKRRLAVAEDNIDDLKEEVSDIRMWKVRYNKRSGS